MDFFDIATIIVGLSAILSYVNYRVLRLPSTTGILALTLALSVLLISLNQWGPAWHLREVCVDFLRQIDFTTALMRGMLCFLLFAGALELDLRSLRANGWTVFSLSTIGVVISTLIIGFVTDFVFARIGLQVPLYECLLLGALISPTDPIAVIALLKYLKAPQDIETQFAGEALFNDGMGVVVFLAFLSLAGLGDADSAHLTLNFPSLAPFFLLQTMGGVLLGLTLGSIALLAIKTVDYHPLELLITVALVMLTYALSFLLGVSGLIAVVVAGILIGSFGRKSLMSEKTVEHLDAFWSMIDEVMNAALFLLLGLQVLGVAWSRQLLGAGLLVIPIVLVARGISVALPVSLLRLRKNFHRGIVPVLTWGGLRGSISVAMVLSLPPFPAKELLVSCTYLVMLFSVLVQGLTMKRLLIHYRVGTKEN